MANGDVIDSVEFQLDYELETRTENVAPYAVAGGIYSPSADPNYNFWSPFPPTGTHILTATPYDSQFGSSGTGSPGVSLTIAFIVP